MIFWAAESRSNAIPHLERLYANSRDILAKEAVVSNRNAVLTGNERQEGPRVVVYPQDKFVLVNAGDDLWDFPQRGVLSAKKSSDTQVDKNYPRSGCTGEAIWGAATRQGVCSGYYIHRTFYTRYYRCETTHLRPYYYPSPTRSILAPK